MKSEVRTVEVQTDVCFPHVFPATPVQAINDVINAYFQGLSAMYQTMGIFFGTGKQNVKM